MKRSPAPIDVQVGKRIRERREALDMSDEELGHALGVTAGQMRHYQDGESRLSALQLFDVCKALDVTPRFFFEPRADDHDTRVFIDEGASAEPETADARRSSIKN